LGVACNDIKLETSRHKKYFVSGMMHSGEDICFCDVVSQCVLKCTYYAKNTFSLSNDRQNISPKLVTLLIFWFVIVMTQHERENAD
jgi:hypothetical protein